MNDIQERIESDQKLITEIVDKWIGDRRKHFKKQQRLHMVILLISLLTQLILLGMQLQQRDWLFASISAVLFIGSAAVLLQYYNHTRTSLL